MAAQRLIDGWLLDSAIYARENHIRTRSNHSDRTERNDQHNSQHNGIFRYVWPSSSDHNRLSERVIFYYRNLHQIAAGGLLAQWLVGGHYHGKSTAVTEVNFGSDKTTPL